MTETVTTLGPISYLIVEFPEGTLTGSGFELLVDLSDRGLIRILDLEFVARDRDGGLTAVELSDVDGDGTLDLTIFDGAASGLLDDDDYAEAATAIAPGASAAIVIFENRWAAAFTDTLRRDGAQLVAAGYIPQDALVASLDATEG